MLWSCVEERQRHRIQRKRYSLFSEPGFAQCAVGNYTTTFGATWDNDFIERVPISYGRTFSRVPTVLSSIAGFERGKIAPGPDEAIAGQKHGHEYKIEITVYDPTKDNFVLKLDVQKVQIKRLEVTWIACT